MLEETGFIAREEGDEFLVLTCPGCMKEIVFTQLADPHILRETATRHVVGCGAHRTSQKRSVNARLAETAVSRR